MTLFKTVQKLALLSVLAGLALTAQASIGSAQQGPSIRIAVEGAFPPFNYLDSNKQLQGFDVDVTKALCAAAEIHCDFVIQEWTGMIPNLLANRYDAIVSSMSMSLERRQKVAFTRKYYDSPSIFIAKKSYQIDLPRLDALNSVRLGVTAETSQEAFAKRFYPNARLTVFAASPELYTGLAEGKVDLILEDKLAVYDWLANTKAGSCCEFKGNDIKNAEFFGDGAGIAVRPDDADLLRKLNAALDVIQSDGVYDTINAKYFPFSIQ
jgi:polar amino acid transport system substrate-binding protein